MYSQDETAKPLNVTYCLELWDTYKSHALYAYRPLDKTQNLNMAYIGSFERS